MSMIPNLSKLTSIWLLIVSFTHASKNMNNNLQYKFPPANGQLQTLVQYTPSGNSLVVVGLNFEGMAHEMLV
jgi:hypothetical protein